jgi:hypothetical protein
MTLHEEEKRQVPALMSRSKLSRHAGSWAPGIHTFIHIHNNTWLHPLENKVFRRS